MSAQGAQCVRVRVRVCMGGIWLDSIEHGIMLCQESPGRSERQTDFVSNPSSAL